MDEPIPLVDLRAQYRSVGEKIERAVHSVLERGDFILGKEVQEFEERFARSVGTKHAVGVASGLDAIALALRALGVGPGDEVVTAANTFVASAFGITLAGATPVLCDARDDGTIDPSLLERAITARTRAVLPVHLYGQPAEMTSIKKIANQRNLPIVEDAAQAHGAVHASGRAGALGKVAAWSFYPGKNLGAAGDAGAITTDDPALADAVRTLRNVGSKVKYHHERKGVNSRMDTIHAAVLLAKLDHLDDWNARRAAAAALYSELLGSVRGVRLPRLLETTRVHAWHLYVVELERGDRDRVLARLHEEGIGAGVHYPVPIHLQPAYAELGKGRGSFPVSERLATRILSLPIYPEIAPAQQERVVRALARALDA